MAYGSKRYVCDTELKLRLCIKSVYNVKSLALTLSFSQVFKDAATERRVKFSSKFKHPEYYYDIPKPHPWKSMFFQVMVSDFKLRKFEGASLNTFLVIAI